MLSRSKEIAAAVGLAPSSTHEPLRARYRVLADRLRHGSRAGHRHPTCAWYGCSWSKYTSAAGHGNSAACVGPVSI